MIARQAQLSEREEKYRLRRLKALLQTQMEEESSAADLSLAQLMERAEKSRMAKIAEETKGMQPKKREKRFYPGTTIERKRIRNR
eukprot:CAMPEP_0170635098 /NCGR_PEP_ID=MMETSP0224-20130122/37016_1 /TAXON_ID=285029 /ORGANISM="Togula jolla, Strain CCCM 725" /LENGTH=84 /DNA_ID=CAMNT_0010964527 /DNA_START=74 /DNA_END=325 /DNA_ORIENTATION=+